MLKPNIDVLTLCTLVTQAIKSILKNVMQAIIILQILQFQV